MNDVLQRISAIGIVPVVKIDDVEKAVPLAKALLDGGLPCAEITFRTAQAEEAIKRITAALPEMLVGAGTVLTTEQADRAYAAGAKFMVSPGLNPKVVSHCLSRGIPITPGCANPSDIELAIELGLDVVKFFPAEACGGVKMIKALSGPFPKLRFIPTGGINADNLNDYLANPKVLACGGSWMVKDTLINEGRFEEITELTRQAVRNMLGFRMVHLGINGADSSDAEGIAQLFCTAFGFEYKPGNSSVFAGGAIEVMRQQGRGTRGHIAIGTNSVERAKAYFEGRGYKFIADSEKKNAAGNTVAIYFEQEFGGFAVHLLLNK